MKTLSKLTVALALLLSLLPKASATVYDFTYTDVISTANTPGISVGDAFTVHLFADNGGSTTISQNWNNADALGFTISAGSYFATYSVPFPGLNISTDGSGTVSSVTFWGTDYTSNNTDNFGSWTADIVFGNAQFSDFFGRSNNIASGTFNIASQWTVSTDSVPESTATLPLMGLTLIGLAIIRRRK